MKVSVIIPAHNEEKNIGSVIDNVKKFCDDIIIVDDYSKDKTAEIAHSKDVFVLKHNANLGKGAALRNGCDFAVKKGVDVLIVMDADGQHDPKEIPNFIKAIENVDIVFGYRGFSKDMPFIKSFGNWGITKLTKVFYGLSLKDSQNGYKAFTTNAYKKIRWKSDSYSVESEIIARASKNKLKYKQVVIPTIYLGKKKGMGILDGIKVGKDIVKWKLVGLSK